MKKSPAGTLRKKSRSGKVHFNSILSMWSSKDRKPLLEVKTDTKKELLSSSLK